MYIEEDKKEFGKWWIWILALVIITGSALTLMKFGGVAIERFIFETSYQKDAGDKKQLNTWQAQLAAINSRLVSDPTNTNLNAQKAMLEIQIQGMK